MEHLGTRPLETPRLLLRRFLPEDAAPMYRNWASDPEVTEFLTWQPHESVEAAARTIEGWIHDYQRLDCYLWAIVPKDLGEPIGSISIVQQDDNLKMVHFGYCIGTPWWGKGVMSEALAALIKFFFEAVGVNRIESRHSCLNPGSGAVMVKCGLKY